MESFVSAREYLNFCSKRSLPAILYKVDFENAFDTVNWCFLMNLLVERGFPPGWISVILSGLQTSTSTIKVNGIQTSFFMHKSGLHQGDPLSPMLFILVADTLNLILSNSALIMPRHAGLKPQTIQYADDTLLICEAHPTTIKIVSHVLNDYTKLTGLKINQGKSCFISIAIPHNLIGVIQCILSSPPSQLPIRYLGLPLSVKIPRKIDYQLMLSAVQGKIQGWTSQLLSYGGRVTLVKAILSAMPLHYMQAFKIPVGVIKHIDRMRRNFLWKGGDTCKAINCLVNWERVCLMKINGGLGIIDLRTQNEALLSKWLWTIDHHPDGLWHATTRLLQGLTSSSDIDNLRPDASFFLKELADLRCFYASSVVTNGGFWNGDGLNPEFSHAPRHTGHCITLE